MNINKSICIDGETKPEKQYAFNEESLKAFAEVEDIIKHPENYKSYTDVHQMMEDLLR